MKIFFILLIIGFCLSGCNSNNQNDTTYTPTKTSYQGTSNTTQKQSQEIEISSFSTPIIYKDENRDHNMALTCSFLNGTIVKSKETFSFCNTVRKSDS